MFGFLLALYLGMAFFIFIMSTFMMTLDSCDYYQSEDILINAAVSVIWPFIFVLFLFNFLFTTDK